MQVEVLGSGSSGNCYKLSDGKTTLLLECGLPFKTIKRKLGFKLSEVDACLITHEHMDHAKAVKDLMKNGVDCYMTKGTAEALGVKGHRLKTFKEYGERQYNLELIGSFKVLPFEVIHDVKEPVGYFIKNIRNEKSLVFVTDTAYMKYKIPNCNTLMIECNYVKDRLDESLELGYINTNLRNRIVKNHLSLETLLDALDMDRLTSLEKIYILHLSDSNSDEKVIKKAIQAKTGVMVEVC